MPFTNRHEDDDGMIMMVFGLIVYTVITMMIDGDDVYT